MSPAKWLTYAMMTFLLVHSQLAGAEQAGGGVDYSHAPFTLIDPPKHYSNGLMASISKILTDNPKPGTFYHCPATGAVLQILDSKSNTRFLVLPNNDRTFDFKEQGTTYFRDRSIPISEIQSLLDCPAVSLGTIKVTIRSAAKSSMMGAGNSEHK